MKVVQAFFFLVVMSCGPAAPPDDARNWSVDDRDRLLMLLDSSFNEIVEEVEHLDEALWLRKPLPDKWSVGEIIEHLIVHEELFYRELRVLSSLPEMTPMHDSLFAGDADILTYSTITTDNSGPSPWYLEPRGRWTEKLPSMNHYHLYRHKMMELIANSNADFRKYYTTSGRGPTRFRDLHQLVLVSVSHTRRHLQQIRNVKTELNLL